jgi:hypothetical protein
MDDHVGTAAGGHEVRFVLQRSVRQYHDGPVWSVSDANLVGQLLPCGSDGLADLQDVELATAKHSEEEFAAAVVSARQWASHLAEATLRKKC